jgi:spermidine synthase
MKKPFFKSILSYFIDIQIEYTSSEFNEDLFVFLSDGRHQLRTNKAIYSFEDKYVNFYKTFKALDWEKINIEKVLVLGLGLGAIPQMLEINFEKQFEYHVVEIDEEIINLAQKYTLNELKSPIYVYEMDAEIFVDITEEKFDLIIIDIFIDSTVPKKFESADFLEKLKYLLYDNGIILFNRLNSDTENFLSNTKYFDKVFKTEFPESKMFFVKNNIILTTRNDIFLR